MDVTKILEQLKEERDQIEAAIVTLERLAMGRTKRRGRPPTWMVEARRRSKGSEGMDMDVETPTAAPTPKTGRGSSKSAVV